MKVSNWLPIILVFLLGSSPSFATPVLYQLDFSALLGPSGTGSFVYDAESISLTNLTWDFGSGITGNVAAVSSTPRPVIGGSASSSLAEILTQTDLNPSNCIAPLLGTCRFTFFSLSSFATPGGVNSLSFEVGPSFGTSVYYSFASATSDPFVPGGPPPQTIFGPSTANGYVNARPAVSEPSTAALLAIGLLLLTKIRRKTRLLNSAPQ